MSSNTASMQQFIKDRVVVAVNGCWTWQQRINKVSGYAQLYLGRTTYAHRLSHEAFIGPIPKGLTVDHVCHTLDASCPGGSTCLHRRCCNPAHLEAVTARENVLRSPNAIAAINAAKTHCLNDHEFTPDNTYGAKRGRQCRACQRVRSAQWKARRGGLLLAQVGA